MILKKIHYCWFGGNPLSEEVKRYHLHLNGEKTMFGENMVFLPFDYLCTKSLETGEILRSENTFTIHFILARISGGFMMISLHEEIKKKIRNMLWMGLFSEKIRSMLSQK